MLAIGKKLISLREKKGLSQYEVAERLGISRSRYNSWENDIANPRTEMLSRLADFFEVTPNDLTDYTANPTSNVTEGVIRELVEKYNIDLTDPHKKELLEKMIRIVAED